MDQPEPSTASDAKRINAEYAQAGMAVKTSIFRGPSISGTVQGVAFRHRVVPGGRNSPPRAELTARTTLRGEFSVRREGSREGFFKAIGLAGEAQSGDAAFDRDFYLAGVSREYVQALFSDARNREAVRALFGLGFERVALNDGELVASRSGPARLLELGAVRSALDQFAALRTTPGAMQLAIQGIGGIRTRQIFTAGTIAAGVAVAAFMATVFLLDPMLDGQFAMYRETWRVALYAYLPLFLLALIALRGRANAPQELLIVALLGVPSLWIGSVSGAMLANQYLDASPQRTVRVALSRHYESRGKNTSYHLVFAPWGKRRSHVNIIVSFDTYRKAKRNQTWVLHTRAGHFGYEWVDALEPASNHE